MHSFRSARSFRTTGDTLTSQIPSLFSPAQDHRLLSFPATPPSLDSFSTKKTDIVRQKVLLWAVLHFQQVNVTAAGKVWDTGLTKLGSHILHLTSHLRLQIPSQNPYCSFCPCTSLLQHLIQGRLIEEHVSVRAGPTSCPVYRCPAVAPPWIALSCLSEAHLWPYHSIAYTHSHYFLLFLFLIY